MIAFSLVVEALKRGEPRKNSKRVHFGIIRKQISCTITYPKSSQILFGETFLCAIIRVCGNRFETDPP